MITVVVEPLADGRTWRTVRSFRFMPPTGSAVLVPQGFHTDFASVPRMCQALLPPMMGRYTTAAVLHDWLYWTQDRPRWAADRVFQAALRTAGVVWWRRVFMFSAARLFSGRTWRERTN